MILWVIFWIMENHNNFQLLKDKRDPYFVLFILFIAFYVWQVVGLIYSVDYKMGLSNLFGRLSLIVFPLVLYYPGETVKKHNKNILRTFVLFTSGYLLFCYGFALYRSLTIDDGRLMFNPHPPEFWLNYFYSAELLINKHPSYFSLYVLLAILISLEEFFYYHEFSGGKAFWLIMSSFLLLSQYFISSRAGLLASLIFLPIYFLIKLKSYQKWRYYWIIVVAIIIVAIPVIINNQRVDYVLGEYLGRKVDYERKDDPRFKIWEASFKIIKSNLLLGVGIGDVRNELVSEYSKSGEKQLMKERYNAHNQFLEVLIENGIIGFIIFLSIIVKMYLISYKERNLLLCFFVSLFIIFFMFETLLYRLAGVAFFSVFSFILLHRRSLSPKIFK
jgi:O-antigen ligase